MTIDRFGRAEPLDQKTFKRVLQSFNSPSHRLIWAICWYCLAKPSSVLRLTVEEVYTNPATSSPRDAIRIPLDRRCGNRSRLVPVSQQLARELNLYQPGESGWLFPGPTGKPLTFGAYQKALYSRFERLGLVGYTTLSPREGALVKVAVARTSSLPIIAVAGLSSFNPLSRHLDKSQVGPDELIALL